ncbi:hypothetical protein [Paraferrimonas sp. SM1919]|nr:hypothetical protein [Paraferrimonas sp. SM1919]
MQAKYQYSPVDTVDIRWLLVLPIIQTNGHSLSTGKSDDGHREQQPLHQ